MSASAVLAWKPDALAEAIEPSAADVIDIAQRFAPALPEARRDGHRPTVIDHEPSATGIVPGAVAIAMACWALGFRVLWAAILSCSILALADLKAASRRAAYSLVFAYAVGGVGWGAFVGLALVLLLSSPALATAFAVGAPVVFAMALMVR